MDDTSPKPATPPQSNIDDLVKELSRPQSIPPAPSTPSTMPSSNVPSSAPAMPPRPMASPSAPSSVPNPVPSAPKPSSVPATPPVPAAPSAPKEYQSSIRTMNDDLSKLKAGQQPQGVNIPRKVDTSPPAPVKPPVPAAPPASAPKPPITSGMNQAVKSVPLAPVNNPVPKPTTPPPAPSRPVPSPAPGAVTVPPPSKASEIKQDVKSQFSVPSASGSSSGARNAILIGIAVLVVLLGGLYWYLMIRNTDVQVTESPIVTFTPRPTATPNPDALATVFSARGGTIVLPAAGDPVAAFNNALSAQPNITPGTFTALDIAGGVSSGSPQLLTITGLLDRFMATYPTELSTALGRNFKILVYGQKESFDAKGKPVANPVASTRLAIVSEIASSSAVVLQAWEPTMATSLAGVMNIVPAKNKGPVLATTYQNVPVRFKNFPYPDRSIDYALIKYGTKTYLIIASSRESMFAAIDAFLSPSIQGK